MVAARRREEEARQAEDLEHAEQPLQPFRSRRGWLLSDDASGKGKGSGGGSWLLSDDASRKGKGCGGGKACNDKGKAYNDGNDKGTGKDEGSGSGSGKGALRHDNKGKGKSRGKDKDKDDDSDSGSNITQLCSSDEREFGGVRLAPRKADEDAVPDKQNEEGDDDERRHMFAAAPFSYLPNLPPPWVAVPVPNTKGLYYWNQITNEVSWTHPVA